MAKRHISEVSSQKFSAAIRQSLDRLVAAKQCFFLSDVIRGAKYVDESSVGATTIYAKTCDGKYVHAELLAKIKVASARSRQGKGAKGGPVDPVQAATMGGHSQALQRQLVEQEDRIQELEQALASVNLKLGRAQEERYVTLGVLNRLTRGALLEVGRPLRELEGQLAGGDLLSRLKVEVESLTIRCRRLVRDT